MTRHIPSVRHARRTSSASRGVRRRQYIAPLRHHRHRRFIARTCGGGGRGGELRGRGEGSGQESPLWPIRLQLGVRVPLGKGRGERGGPRRTRRTAQGAKLPAARSRKEKGELLPHLRFCPGGHGSKSESSSPKIPVRDLCPTAFLRALRGPPRSLPRGTRTPSCSRIGQRGPYCPEPSPRPLGSPPRPPRPQVRAMSSTPR